MCSHNSIYMWISLEVFLYNDAPKDDRFPTLHDGAGDEGRVTEQFGSADLTFPELTAAPTTRKN